MKCFLLDGIYMHMHNLKTNLIKQTNLWVCVFLWRRSTMCHDLLEVPLTLPGKHPISHRYRMHVKNMHM